MCVPHSLSNLHSLSALQEEVKLVPLLSFHSVGCSGNVHIVRRVAAMKETLVAHKGSMVDRRLGTKKRDLGFGNRRVYATNLTRDGETEREPDTQEATVVDSSKKLLTLPTILTLARIAAIPALLAVFYNSSWWSTTGGAAIFVVASLTDWLDGYLARKMKTNSAFGAFLDPVADKLMVATALILLCTRPLHMEWARAASWLIPIPAIAIISREITMSAVREWAASQGGDVHKAVAVNNIGKWKTASQMVALTLLLIAKDGSFDAGGWISATGLGLLYMAGVLAWWSLAIYMKAIWGSFSK